MNVCIVAATEQELAEIEISHTQHEKQALAVGSFYFGQKLEELLRSRANEFELIVLVGIAGCTQKHTLGSFVLIKDDQFGDLGFISNHSFETIEELGLRETSKQISLDFNNAWRYKTGESKAKAITVNSIYNDNNLNKLRLDKYHAEIENMEGAAFHLLCEKYKVPYLHIRGLSNYIGERDKSQWKIKEAIISYSTFINKELATWK